MPFDDPQTIANGYLAAARNAEGREPVRVEQMPTIQDAIRRRLAAERGEQVDESVGVDEATQAIQDYDNGWGWMRPVHAFNTGLGRGFPFTGWLHDRWRFNRNWGEPVDPGVRYALNKIGHQRQNHPAAYYSGLALGLAPGALFPKVGGPWAAYVLGTDPNVQRTARDWWRSSPEATPSGW